MQGRSGVWNHGGWAAGCIMGQPEQHGRVGCESLVQEMMCACLAIPGVRWQTAAARTMIVLRRTNMQRSAVCRPCSRPCPRANHHSRTILVLRSSKVKQYDDFCPCSRKQPWAKHRCKNNVKNLKCLLPTNPSMLGQPVQD